MGGVLSGLRIVDMGHFVAVPSAGAVLADWGAEVLKVEPLSGESQRGIDAVAKALKMPGTAVNWRFEVHNRNKKSLAVDLVKPLGTALVYKLLEKSDVFMSNYEPSSLKKLKMDYPLLKRINPRLVYAMLTGYGTRGREKKERGFDFTAAWARSGIQYLLAESDGPPPQQRGGMMDRTVGMHMVAGILAALLRREKTGRGQKIEFCLYHSAVWTLAADIQVTLGGQPPLKQDRTKSLNPLVNTYHTKDDRWLQLAMLQSDLQWSGFCRAIESPELETDPRFASMEARAQNCEDLIRILDQIFAMATLREWEERLKEHGCIYARIQTPDEVICDPQAIANNFFAEIEHPVAGRTKLVTTPVKFVRNPASVKIAAPEVGQHTEEVLVELGYTWDDIARLKDERVIL